MVISSRLYTLNFGKYRPSPVDGGMLECAMVQGTKCRACGCFRSRGVYDSSLDQALACTLLTVVCSLVSAARHSHKLQGLLGFSASPPGPSASDLNKQP